MVYSHGFRTEELLFLTSKVKMKVQQTLEKQTKEQQQETKMKNTQKNANIMIFSVVCDINIFSAISVGVNRIFKDNLKQIVTLSMKPGYSNSTCITYSLSNAINPLQIKNSRQTELTSVLTFCFVVLFGLI